MSNPPLLDGGCVAGHGPGSTGWLYRNCPYSNSYCMVLPFGRCYRGLERGVGEWIGGQVLRWWQYSVNRTIRWGWKVLVISIPISGVFGGMLPPGGSALPLHRLKTPLDRVIQSSR